LEKIQEEFESLMAIYEEDGVVMEEASLKNVMPSVLQPKLSKKEKKEEKVLQEVVIKGKKGKVWRKKSKAI
jgi:hypothetical protein